MLLCDGGLITESLGLGFFICKLGVPRITLLDCEVEVRVQRAWPMVGTLTGVVFVE